MLGITAAQALPTTKPHISSKCSAVGSTTDNRLRLGVTFWLREARGKKEKLLGTEYLCADGRYQAQRTAPPPHYSKRTAHLFAQSAASNPPTGTISLKPHDDPKSSLMLSIPPA